MKQYYSAKELSDFSLPGLPGTVQGINAKAEKEGWISQQRKGRGGGREYAFQSLPEIARKWIVDHSIEQTSLPFADSLPPAPAPRNDNTSHLKDCQRRRMEARLVVLQYIDQLAASIGRQERALRDVVDRARNGTLPEPVQRAVATANGHASGVKSRTLSRRTIMRWRAARDKGHAALAPKPNNTKKMPEWGIPFLKTYRVPQKISIAEAIRRMESAGLTAPSYDAARRFLAMLGEVEKNRGRMLPRELKALRPFVRRDSSALWPCDVFTADGHTFDAEVAHPFHGQPFRPEVTLILDVATRMAVGWSITLAESGLAVLDALRHAVTRHGIPALFYVDNGGGYKNELMRDEVTGFMARLGIDMTHSLPYNSQARGVIERGHQTLWVNAAKQLPTFVGADMDAEARKIAFKRTRADGAGLIGWQDFCGLIDHAATEYNNRPHSTLEKVADTITGKRRSLSPIEAWEAASREGWVPVIPEHTEDLFRPQEKRQVRRGEVALFGNLYFSLQLEEWHGQEVLVGYDVWDASKVWVRSMKGALICEAVLDGNKRDYFPQSVIEQAREKRARGRLKRLEIKRAEIEAEAGRMADATPQPLSPEEMARAAAYQARLEAKPEEPTHDAKGRPIFRGEFADRDWGKWVLANWNDVEQGERALFMRRCQSSVYRELIGIEEGELKGLAV